MNPIPILRSAARDLHRFLGGGGWIALAAAAFCASSLWSLAAGAARRELFYDLSLVVHVNWWWLGGVFLGSAVLLAGMTLVWRGTRILAWALLTLSLGLGVFLAVNAPSNVFFSLGLCFVLFLVLRWVLAENRLGVEGLRVPGWATLLAAGLLFLGFTALLSFFSILRYRTYNATNFDLGLFAQMFEFLRKTGHAWTTLERNRLMTHFGVHCSPFFYLLLPFYDLVPRLETLLVLQAAAVGAGVFAVRGIAKEMGFSGAGTLAACLLYVLHPAIPEGCLFDFHENKFLAVLLLAAFYFLLRQKTLPLLLFAALCLTVKEDAAIYVAALGGYLLLCRKREWPGGKRLRAGLLLLGMSAVWFVCACWVVRRYGDGVMLDRLRNYFLPGEENPGYLDLIKTSLSNVGFIFQEVFTREKAEFLLWMFLPVAFTPFWQPKNGRLILLLPLLVINLLSNYTYQYTVGYQYTYGTTALVLLLALLALRDMGPALRRLLLCCALAAGLFVTLPLSGSRMAYYAGVMQDRASQIAAADAVLAALPPREEVSATTWFAVHLYRRENVYMFPNYYDEARVTEYLLCKPEEAEENEQLADFLSAHYTLIRQEELVQLYQKNAWE
ncbi:MAG: DUF2079 domain-containing protein [Oscillospiraceae bacterium]|jgi:uncharacterized membrane protein|nr:DUF2079 domain-containing protein [Oscillospiraceae bacterium]